MNGVHNLLDVHKVVLLSQLGLPEAVLDDEGLSKTNNTVDTALASIVITQLAQRSATGSSTYQSAAHDGVGVLLGLLRNVARHALVGLTERNGGKWVREMPGSLLPLHARTR